MWYNNDEATIKRTAENLRNYLNHKLAVGFKAPIFVISHLPLHYSMRTRNDGDKQHANYIFNVLNDAGGNGLNIVSTVTTIQTAGMIISEALRST